MNGRLLLLGVLFDLSIILILDFENVWYIIFLQFINRITYNTMTNRKKDKASKHLSTNTTQKTKLQENMLALILSVFTNTDAFLWNGIYLANLIQSVTSLM